MSEDEYDQIKKKKCVISVVTADKLFNLPLYEVYLVIDCRNSINYDESHIASAFNYPPPKEGCGLKSLYKLFAYMSNNCSHERWNPLVLYGDSDPQVIAHMKRFVESLKELIDNPIAYENPDSPDSELFYNNIVNKVSNLWVLEGGFEAFQHQYGFQCLPALIHTVRSDPCGASLMRPTPHHISHEGNGIFIGSRAIEWTPDYLSAIQVSAIVTDPKNRLQFGNMHEEASLLFFVCSISNDEDGSAENQQVSIWSQDRLGALFDGASEFIQSAVLARQRVLVQLNGRSHSAALVIAWYMRYQGMDFDAAKAILQGCTRKFVAASSSAADRNDSSSSGSSGRDSNSDSDKGPPSLLHSAQLFERELKAWATSSLRCAPCTPAPAPITSQP
jgi:hypothetical protein